MKERINLFPETAPGSEGVQLEENNFTLIDEKNGQESAYVEKVLMPTLTPFFPENPTGTCVIVIPGGGYRRQVITKEGLRITQWLNDQGITAFILKHRMPGDGHKNGIHVPLQDAQRSIRVIRSRTEEWGIQKDNIGVMGFSAGGHVAATLATCYDKKVYTEQDDVDAMDTRPDFAALIYPVISFHSYSILNNNLPDHAKNRKDIIKEYPTDKLISKNTPPTFIVGSDDDQTTPSENCVNFYLGLREARIPSEMHIFKKGGHGFGLGQGRGNVEQWPPLFQNWLSLQIK